MTTNFSDTDVTALLQLAGEVGELQDDLHVRRKHILNGLLDLIGGCSAVCSEVDPRHAADSGWAMPNSITCGGKLSTHQLGLIDRYLTGHHFAVDPCIPPLLRKQMSVATVRRADVIDRSWYDSEHYNEVRRPLGFGESIYGKLITPDGRHLKLSLHREFNAAPFTERDVNVMHVFNENLGRLYIAKAKPRTSATVQLPTDNRVASLPRRLRPVLQHLLAGDAEKQVAFKLGLSPHTVHEYTKLLYRSFNVNSRGELLAQFVTRSVA